jgi:hypothetical protein
MLLYSSLFILALLTKKKKNSKWVKSRVPTISNGYLCVGSRSFVICLYGLCVV